MTTVQSNMIEASTAVSVSKSLTLNLQHTIMDLSVHLKHKYIPTVTKVS